jgi:hypothetical protein
VMTTRLLAALIPKTSLWVVSIGRRMAATSPFLDNPPDGKSDVGGMRQASRRKTKRARFVLPDEHRWETSEASCER